MHYLTEFGAQLLYSSEEIFSLLLIICPLLLQLLIPPLHCPHAYLQLLFVAFQQFQKFIRALCRLKWKRFVKTRHKYLKKKQLDL